MKNINKQLFEAVLSNEIEEVKKLIEKGADLNVVNEYGETALHSASYEGYSKIVKMLIEAGADVNAVCEDRKTALYWASFCNYSEIVKILIEAGADVNIVNKDGETALYWASHWGYSEIVKMLEEAGANVNAVDNNSNTKMEDIINKILVNNYRIEIEKCLTMQNLVKITALGKDINCFLYNLNVSFEEQKDDCKLAIEKLSQKK